MSFQYRSRVASALLVTIALVACSDDDPASTAPETPAGDFAGITAILQADCAGCHLASSGRSFTVSMDSATLVGSGFIDPQDPGNSLLLFKPRSASHGGGIVATFTAADSATLATWIKKQPATGATKLVAVKTIGSVSPDGFDSEDSWRGAKWLAFRIGGGWADATEVYMKALYDATYVYMILKWTDDKASYTRQPFIKQADGSWKKAAAKPLPKDGDNWAKYMGTAFDEEGPLFLYEDKLALAWNTYGAGTTPLFEQAGCAGLCHDPGDGAAETTYFYSDQKRATKKYTNSANEIVDLWHWKLVRQNDTFKMDDQHVRYWTVGDAGAAEGGRASDEGASGYMDNPATASGWPTYRGKTLAPGLFSFPRADTVRLTAAELAPLPPGTMIASMMTSPLSGARADIDGRGYYNPQTRTWHYELRRKLVTGDTKDVQFDNLDREYKFGVAVFDNAQIEHSWSPAVLRFVFQK